MLRAEVLMATLLVLVPVTAFPLPAHLLVLWEVWPGHGLQYEQVLGAATRSSSYKTTIHMHLEQLTQKRGSRHFRSFRRNLEAIKKNVCRNNQQKNVFKDFFIYKRNLIAGKHVTVKISRKHLGMYTFALRRHFYLRKMLNNILKNAKVEVKINWHSIFSGIGGEIETKNNEQLQITYLENKCKLGAESLRYIALQINTILKFEQKSWEGWKNIALKSVKQKRLRRKKLTETGMFKKESTSGLLNYDQWKISQENRNVNSKNHYEMFTSRKKRLITNRKSLYMGFKKYGPLAKRFQQEEKTKAWKWKTVSKKVTSKNQKLALVFVFTNQNSNSIQKISPPNYHLWSDIQEEIQPAFQRNIFRKRKLIRKLVSMQKAASIIYHNFPSFKIAICLKHELFHSAIDQAKLSVCTTKVPRYLILPLQRVVEKHLIDTQKEFSTILKAFMVKKHLDTETSFPAVGRNKRSATVKTVQIPVDLLRRLTSALVAGATIFGIAFSALILAFCYLYFKRRQLGQFFETMLNHTESRKRSKSTDTRHFHPVSVSQNFHFAPPQESSKKKRARATAFEACSKDTSDFATVKEIYESSDSEGSSKMSHRGLTVRSRAYVCPTWSTGSVKSFCDISDVSSKLSLSDEMVVGNKSSSNATKGKELVPADHQPNNCSSDKQEPSTDILQHLKKEKYYAQLYLPEEIIVENQFSKPSMAVPKEKELVFPSHQLEHSFWDNQEQQPSGNLLLQQQKATFSQIYFPDEIRVEKSVHLLELSIAASKEKELFPAAPYSRDRFSAKEQHNSNDLLLKLNEGIIQKSKSESDINLSSSKLLHANRSLTHIFRDF